MAQEEVLKNYTIYWSTGIRQYVFGLNELLNYIDSAFSNNNLHLDGVIIVSGLNKNYYWNKDHWEKVNSETEPIHLYSILWEDGVKEIVEGISVGDVIYKEKLDREEIANIFAIIPGAVDEWLWNSSLRTWYKRSNTTTKVYMSGGGGGGSGGIGQGY